MSTICTLGDKFMATNFLLRNIKWTFNQNSTDELLSLPTTEAQYTAQLDKLARRYFPERLSIDTVTTEFFLNKIALTSGKSAEGLAIKNRFAHYWAKYEKLRKGSRADRQMLAVCGRRQNACKNARKCR